MTNLELILRKRLSVVKCEMENEEYGLLTHQSYLHGQYTAITWILDEIKKSRGEVCDFY